ncbi:MAG: hypothetical protein ABIQ09_14595 [Jatrophihabitantaceae bacterium]
MCGPPGVKSTPRQEIQHGTGDRSRLRAFPRFLIGALLVLASWWFTAGSALARSYPPALGCAVAGSAPAAAGVIQVRGMGFRAGSRVVVSVAGRPAGGAVADPAGSFEASWFLPDLTPSATVTATDASCTVTSVLVIANQPPLQDETSLPPSASGGGSAVRQPIPAGPAKPGKTRPAPTARPGPAPQPEPAPPARASDPVAAVIPSIPLTRLPPQTFLGLAGALLLAGVALTGLTGRWGHRGERRTVASSGTSSVSSTLPVAPGNALGM